MSSCKDVKPFKKESEAVYGMVGSGWVLGAGLGRCNVDYSSHTPVRVGRSRNLSSRAGRFGVPVALSGSVYERRKSDSTSLWVCVVVLRL